MVALVIGLLVYVVFLSLVCGAALVLGGRSERLAAGALLAAAALTQVAALAGPHWRGPEYEVMMVDVGLLVVLVGVAHHSSRFWPIWAAAAQLAGTVTHALPMLGHVPGWLYASAQPFWAFPLLGAIACGVVAEMRVRRETAGRGNIAAQSSAAVIGDGT